MTMNKKQSKRQRDIKTKLMAAICMLLVSSIMMVSTTYAWFTLSTAPEVTGISTAVGANGNLEMALLPADGSIETINLNSGVGDSTLPINERNITWGNLVDVSSPDYYGLQNITLYPSALVVQTSDDIGNPDKLSTAALLATPTYGADGRVSELVSNTSTGVYNTTNKSFYPDAGDTTYGVRAVGTASGMTERQLVYRNAKAAGNAAKGLAATYASQSLHNNGNALASIAVKKGLDGAAAKYTKADLEAMGAIINDLTKNGGVLDQIETAYIQYLVAFSASSKVTDDSVWSTILATAEAEGATLTTVMAKVNDLLGTAGVTLPEKLTEGITAFNGSVTKVADAKRLYDTLIATNAETYAWEDFSPILTNLANPDKMEVNDIPTAEVMDRKQELIDDVIGGNGIRVAVTSGGGVYADVADQSGDYTADVKITGVEYSGVNLNTDAVMKTKSGVKPAYLALMETGVNEAGAPASGATGSNPMSDMFGYVIDMAFRTNAAESELRLQQDAVDRIYKENTVGGQIGEEEDAETTMGHGANMTFQSADPTFSSDKVKSLMDAIRLVFFDPDSLSVYATGKLDTANATISTDGVTAKIYLYEKAANGTTTYTEIAKSEYDLIPADSGMKFYKRTVSYEEAPDAAAGDGKTYYTKADDNYTKASEIVDGTTYYTEKITYTEYESADAILAAYEANEKVYVQKVAAAGEVAVANNKIMDLTQNTAQKLSVLVYLDGNLVTNADVATSAAQSMSGKMNLQFTSSANLDPMDYAQLMTNGNTTTETPDGGEEGTN